MSGKCADDTIVLNAAEPIKAEAMALQEQVDSLDSTEFCTTPALAERRCVVQYDALENNVREECERHGGHYLENYYKAECEGDSSKFVYAAEKEPGCVSSQCDDDEKNILLKNSIEARVGTRLEGSGAYDCEVTYFRAIPYQVQIDTQRMVPLSAPPSESPTPKPTETVTTEPTKLEPASVPVDNSPEVDNPTLRPSSSSICGGDGRFIVTAFVAVMSLLYLC